MIPIIFLNGMLLFQFYTKRAL